MRRGGGGGAGGGGGMAALRGVPVMGREVGWRDGRVGGVGMAEGCGLRRGLFFFSSFAGTTVLEATG